MIEFCGNCCGGAAPGADNVSEEVPLTKIGSRILTVLVVLALLATGPLAPLAAAQQPAPPSVPPQQEPAPPPVTQAPPPPPAGTPPPAPAETPTQPMVQEVPEQESHAAESAAYNVGAGIANVFYIPGKGLLCGVGGMVGIAILFISLGSAPKPAAYFAREGCGGKWILTGDDLRPDDSHYRAFDWESDSRY